jgi:Putative Ig domain/Abnormal spindle-like microcephaly-assoc'd, ASPM-SPD-2-Hydin
MNSPSLIRQVNGRTITTKKTLRMLAGGAISLLMLLFIYAGEASARPDGSYGYNCSSCHSGRPDQNPPPVLNPIGAKTVSENQALTFTATATDPNGNALTFSGGGLPTGATLNATTGAFSWTPSFTQGGQSYSVTVTVTDNGSPAASDFETFTITVGNVNRPPVLGAIGAKTATEGTPLTFTATATDPDGGALTFSSATLPTGATLTPAGVFSWTPTSSQGQTTPFSVTVIVTDAGGLNDQETFTITVGDVNRPPVLATIGNKNVNGGQPLAFQASASDPDGGALAFAATNLPAGASLSPSGAFSWTPTTAQAGNYSVTVTVTDVGSPALSDSETFTITVGNVNRPPVLASIGNRTGTEGQALTFTINASDPDGGTLTFTPTGLPSGATLTPGANGIATFSWTPASGQAIATPYSLTVAVSDGALADSETFTITVNASTAVNRAPTVTNPGNKTVTAGQPLSFTLTGSDPDAGNTLRFAATSTLPSGATLNATTGVFSWTPTAAQASATPYSVTVTATDNGSPALASAPQTFTITVRAPTPTPVCTVGVNPTSLAFGSVNVGSTKTMTTTISNSGTANCTVSSRTVSGTGFALGSGAPSVPVTIAPGANVSMPVNFAPTVAGAASGTLSIGTTAVGLSGTGATVVTPPPPTGGGALSISSFRATEEVHVGEQVRVRLTIRYAGTANASAPATLVGMQKGVKVYDRTMTVSVVGTTASKFTFPSYTPKARGDIKWTVTVGTNTARDTTKVEGGGRSTRSRED